MAYLAYIQCAIPVFDGLLPEPHNRSVMGLLFTLAHWHSLAKLRMHNDLTLEIMDTLTASLGKKLRDFVTKTCPAFETKELRREYNARLRAEANKSERRRQKPNNRPKPTQHPQEGVETTSLLPISPEHLTTGQQPDVDAHLSVPVATSTQQQSTGGHQLSIDPQGIATNH